MERQIIRQVQNYQGRLPANAGTKALVSVPNVGGGLEAICAWKVPTRYLARLIPQRDNEKEH